MNRSILLLAAAAIPAIAAAGAAQSNGVEKPTTVGVYADSEAVKGETVYKATCASCHTTSDQSGPQFQLNWFGKTVYDYIVNLKKTMPDDNPGGLSDDEYRRVTAYVLKLNGFPPGSVPLPTDTTELKLLRIGPPAGDTVKPPRNHR